MPLLASACGGSAETVDPDSAPTYANARIEAYLVARGFDPEIVSIDGERVRVEEDSFTTRSEILRLIDASESEAGKPVPSEPGQVEKAYWYQMAFSRQFGEVINAAPFATVAYSIDWEVPRVWKRAIRAAAGIYNDASPDDCLTLTEDVNSKSHIQFSMGNLPKDKNGYGPVASGEFPLFNGAQQGNVAGSVVIIDHGVSGSTDLKESTATILHEIGHNLGFMHPWEGGHIKATATNTNSGTTASYKTIMDYKHTNGEQLSSDDLTAIDYVFSKHILQTRTGPQICCGPFCNF